MTGSTFQQVDAVVHIHLRIAGEEIYLHTSNPHLLTPGKFTLPVFWFVKPELGTWGSIHPSYGRVIPDKRLNALRFRIADGILYGFAVFHFIPLCINQYIGQSERDSHIHIFPDDVVVVRTMIVGPVDP